MNQPFADRHQAGQLLARRLLAMHLPRPIVVLALPRGGVPVAAPIAKALGAALDLLLVRKIGAPWQPELALAAVAEGSPPDIAIDESAERMADIGPGYIERQAQAELREIGRRRQLYLQGRAPLPVQGCTVIVVDDGIATGSTMRAALQALRRRQPALLVLAVPVAPADQIEALRTQVDRLVCLAQPYPFLAVGHHYVDFRQVDDDEVIAALGAAGPGA